MEGITGSGGYLKKKSSSGCLIIKNKVESRISGVSRDLLINRKEKIIYRSLESESSESDEEDDPGLTDRNKNNQIFQNGSIELKQSGINNSDHGARKRNRLDPIYIDEYNGFDLKRVRNKHSLYSDRNSGGRSEALVCPVSLLGLNYEDQVDKTIRVQGKNGVLKIMLNKKRRMDLNPNLKYDYSTCRDIMSTRPDQALLELKDKKNQKKVVPVKSFKENESKIKEEVEEDTSVLEKVGLSKTKEVKDTKLKRGGSTEKQMLREKIRGMLVDSGWKIDYRPRRNRDYLDAVYINPNGTAYWSIIKAYEAFKKQLEERSSRIKRDVSPTSFAPLSEDLIHKLTRQTKKKIEEEMKRKIKGEIMHRDDGDSNDDDLSNFSAKTKSSKASPEKIFVASTSSDLQRGTNKDIGTVKRTILGWLIDSGIVQLSEKVQYMSRKRNRVMLEGWITRDGIHCGCCSKILTVSKFELHAGSKLRQPFHNILLESGASLLHCQIDAWNKQGESVNSGFDNVHADVDDKDDDICNVCGDGGDLICCDNCPSTFHLQCLELEMPPSVDWMCANCKCKICGDGCRNVHEFSEDKLLRCRFCAEKYHRSCCGDPTLTSTSHSKLFCGLNCQEMHDDLQKIVGVKHELEAGFVWSLLQRADVSDTTHCAFSQRVESNSKLAVALSIMDECFSPMFDHRSRINILRNVVYGIRSNLKRLDYEGFFTAILERGDEMVSVTCIRIHGTRLAEMPFVATHDVYRNQGMCRRLLASIEMELVRIGVETLIIPVLPEQMRMWRLGFGFSEVEDELKKGVKSMNLVVLPGTFFLQKHLVKQENSYVMKGSEHDFMAENNVTSS